MLLFLLLLVRLRESFLKMIPTFVKIRIIMMWMKIIMIMKMQMRMIIRS